MKLCFLMIKAIHIYSQSLVQHLTAKASIELPVQSIFRRKDR